MKVMPMTELHRRAARAVAALRVNAHCNIANLLEA